MKSGGNLSALSTLIEQLSILSLSLLPTPIKCNTRVSFSAVDAI